MMMITDDQLNKINEQRKLLGKIETTKLAVTNRLQQLGRQTYNPSEPEINYDLMHTDLSKLNVTFTEKNTNV
jgi:hypothetical protein